MKRNGFTLIELLAVIVILAIIALIATPIIINIINDAKASSNERSIELYGSAIKNAIAKEQLNGKIVPAGKYSTTTLPFEVEYEGEVDCEEIEIKESGSVSLAKCTVNGTEVDYTYGKEETVAKTYANGEVVYFNVTTGEACTVNDYTESQSNLGVKEGCMKFYAFNDNGGNTVNLLLDHNTTAGVVWRLTTDDIRPTTLLEKLSSDTSNWLGTETPTNYSLNQSSASSGANYTVDYSDYKARIITAEEIAQITGNTSWDVTSESSTMYFFDSLSTIGSSNCYTEYVPLEQSYTPFISGCNYGWLYDRISDNCTNFGCLNDGDSSSSSYWTISTTTFIDMGQVQVWGIGAPTFKGTGQINISGGLHSLHPQGHGASTGVRPVIEVLKSKLQ